MGNEQVTLLTPTGGRPEAFALCERWVARQTWKNFNWVVVDDGGGTGVQTPTTMGQIYRYRPDLTPLAHKVRFALNIGLAGDILFFIEDDDWYAPNYIERALERLGTHLISGEGRALYYHVMARRWALHDNMQHASLCQTVIRRALYQDLLDICNDPVSLDGFLDSRLWHASPERRRAVWEPSPRTLVGMKGLPGRIGYGVGHRPIGPNWTDDDSLSVLTKHIGEDADVYAKYWNPCTR